jgi:hypothetical protein
MSRLGYTNMQVIKLAGYKILKLLSCGDSLHHLHDNGDKERFAERDIDL